MGLRLPLQQGPCQPLCGLCRIRREEERLRKEIEDRELKEAEELLARTGKGKKLKEGEKLDKNAIMQVCLQSSAHCCCIRLFPVDVRSGKFKTIGHQQCRPCRLGICSVCKIVQMN